MSSYYSHYVHFLTIVVQYQTFLSCFFDQHFSWIILLYFYLFKNVKSMSSQLANKIKIILYLISNQFFIVRTILCVTFHDLSYTTTILIIEIFKSHILSSHATCLHTRLTESCLNCRCLLYFAFYMAARQLMNAHVGKCLCLRETSTNVNNLFTLVLFVYLVYVFLAVLLLPVHLFIPFL